MHEIQIAAYTDTIRDLLAVIDRAREMLGYSAEQMETLPAVARAKEMVR